MISAQLSKCGEKTLTLRLLGDGHAQPLQVDAVLAADAGGAAAERMQGDGADDQRQLQEQLGRPGNVHTHLRRGGKDVVRQSWGNTERILLLLLLAGGGVLTLSMYSTLMMRHCRMDGPTGGILMARPCHVSLHRAPTMSPDSVATTERFCFMVPRAMKVCVWMM